MIIWGLTFCLLMNYCWAMFNLYHSLGWFSRRYIGILNFPRKQFLTVHANCLNWRQCLEVVYRTQRLSIESKLLESGTEVFLDEFKILINSFLGIILYCVVFILFIGSDNSDPGKTPQNAASDHGFTPLTTHPTVFNSFTATGDNNRLLQTA